MGISQEAKKSSVSEFKHRTRRGGEEEKGVLRRIAEKKRSKTKVKEESNAKI